MYIRVWDEAAFISVLDSGMYEDLIRHVGFWAEEGYLIYPGKVPAGVNYEQAKRAGAIGIITQEAHQIWKADSSNYYDSYHKIIARIEERREKKLIYKLKRNHSSPSSKEPKEIGQNDKEREQQRLWEKEMQRVRLLKEYCKSNQLDFHKENEKAIRSLKRRYIATEILGWIVYPGLFAGLILLIMWICTPIINGPIGIAIIIGSYVIAIIGGKINPLLPKHYFQKIKDIKYRAEVYGIEEGNK